MNEVNNKGMSDKPKEGKVYERNRYILHVSDSQVLHYKTIIREQRVSHFWFPEMKFHQVYCVLLLISLQLFEGHP